ncbi:MAG: Spy/CpxP family protein refolding chaperone, partial [Janthinobacterium sp.]
ATYAQAPLLREQEKIAFKAHAQLRELAGSSAYDDAKAGALASTAAQAMAKISLLHARLEQQLLAVLTPEQRKQAQQRRDSRPGPSRPQLPTGE